MSTKQAEGPASARNVLIFTLFVLALGWVGRWIDGVAGTGSSMAGGASSFAGPGMTLWIASPLLVSFLLRAFAGDGWRDLGIKVALRGDGRWYAVSILAYPAAAIVLLGINDWSGDCAHASVEALFFPVFVSLLLPQLLTNIFEESGFRGYLAPKLTALGVDRLMGHTIVGLVWGAWHLPYLAAITGYSTETMATFAPRFLLGAIAASVVYGEIRLRTNSFWPAVVMQTVGGAFIGALIAAGHVPGSRYAWLRMPALEGGFMLAMFAALGLWLYARAMERQAGRE